MAYESPYTLIKEIEQAILAKLSAIDIYEVDPKERKAITDLKNGMVDARLDIQDYELSETRDDQLQVARESGERLDHLQQFILILGNFGAFSSVDVALYSAQVEHIKSRLR